MNLRILLTNWHAMRILRLALGVFIGVQAIIRPDAFAGIVAALFLFQAVTNSGCCGSGGCALHSSSQEKGVSNDSNTTPKNANDNAC